MMIRLLVSVRNEHEATIASLAGADIIDVKEPHRGALGYAGSSVITSVQSAIDGRYPVSAALGESLEWWQDPMSSLPETSTPRIPRSLSFLKLGLAHTVTSETHNHWTDVWMAARRRFDDLAETGRKTSPAWVAVSYADFETAQCPPPEEILHSAISTDCRILLVDTFVKNGVDSIACLTESRLTRLRKKACEKGLQFALAGSLNIQHMDSIHRIAPDIVGVRGAACDNTNRESAICGKRISALKALLK